MADALPLWGSLSYRTFSVWRRNWDTYIRRWKSQLWTGVVASILQLLAFGVGVGYYVPSIEGLSYLTFIAPGIVGVTAMFQAAMETSYGAFVRMQLQRTFEAIIATPVNVEEVIAAELLWGATRSCISGILVLIVLAAAGQIHSWWALGMPAAVLLEGLVFAGVGMLFTALAPDFDFFIYLETFALTPMMLFGGVFFPVERLPQAAQAVVWLLPLSHAVSLLRGLALGRIDAGLAGDALWLVAVTALLSTISLALMRRRLIK
jgi:lipooligosaccharide transport system permease protein